MSARYHVGDSAGYGFASAEVVADAATPRGGASPRRVIFVQFSDQLLTPYDDIRRYYAAAYARMPGYVLPEHYFEIPFWIAVISGMFDGSATTVQSLHVSTDIEETVNFIESSPDTTFLYSAMEANLTQLLAVLEQTTALAVVGGYVEPSRFDHLPHVSYLNGIADLLGHFDGLRPSIVPDYRLFRGEQCIPRLSLSTGCSYRCAFCTVPTKVLTTPDDALPPLAAALAPLQFQLAFFDDKSFGDAPGWRRAAQVQELLTAVNPNFSGFIVQTPPSIAARPGFLRECAELGVTYVEFGVETADEALLRQYRKPFRLRHLDIAMERARDLGIRVIPNIIIGFPSDDYAATLEWISRHRDQIPAVNVNWLAVHHGNERGGLGIAPQSVSDRDQNSDAKSWLTTSDVERGWAAVRAIYDMTVPEWRQCRSLSLGLATGLSC